MALGEQVIRVALYEVGEINATDLYNRGVIGSPAKDTQKKPSYADRTSEMRYGKQRLVLDVDRDRETKMACFARRVNNARDMLTKHYKDADVIVLAFSSYRLARGVTIQDLASNLLKEKNIKKPIVLLAMQNPERGNNNHQQTLLTQDDIKLHDQWLEGINSGVRLSQHSIDMQHEASIRGAMQKVCQTAVAWKRKTKNISVQPGDTPPYHSPIRLSFFSIAKLGGAMDLIQQLAVNNAARDGSGKKLIWNTCPNASTPRYSMTTSANGNDRPLQVEFVNEFDLLHSEQKITAAHINNTHAVVVVLSGDILNNAIEERIAELKNLLPLQPLFHFVIMNHPGQSQEVTGIYKRMIRRHLPGNDIHVINGAAGETGSDVFQRIILHCVISYNEIEEVTIPQGLPRGRQPRRPNGNADERNARRSISPPEIPKPLSISWQKSANFVAASDKLLPMSEKPRHIVLVGGAGKIGSVVTMALYNAAKEEYALYGEVRTKISLLFNANRGTLGQVRQHGISTENTTPDIAANGQGNNRRLKVEMTPADANQYGIGFYDDAADITPKADFVVIATKADSLGDVVRRTRGLLAEDGCFCPMQNGLNELYVAFFSRRPDLFRDATLSDARLENEKYEQRLHLLRTYEANMDLFVGCIAHIAADYAENGPGDGTLEILFQERVNALANLVIGIFDTANQARAEEFTRLIHESEHLTAKFADGLLLSIMQKLQVNAALNPVSALTGLRANELMGDIEYKEFMLDVAEEVKQAGVFFGFNESDFFNRNGEHGKGSMERRLIASRDHRPSTLQSVERNEPLEVYPLLGGLIHLLENRRLERGAPEVCPQLIKIKYLYKKLSELNNHIKKGTFDAQQWRTIKDDFKKTARLSYLWPYMTQKLRGANQLAPGRPLTYLHKIHQKRMSRCILAENAPAEMQVPVQVSNKLVQTAALHHFYVQNVTGDGNCFFHAVATQMQDPEVTHSRLREHAYIHILQNQAEYRELIDMDIMEYQNSIRRDGTFVDHLVIQALSRACAINIVIIDEDRNKPPTIFRQHNPRATVYLGCINEMQYIPLWSTLDLNTKGSMQYCVDNTEVDDFTARKRQGMR